MTLPANYVLIDECPSTDDRFARVVLCEMTDAKEGADRYVVSYQTRSGELQLSVYRKTLEEARVVFAERCGN